MPNACEDRLAANTSCNTFSSTANGSTVANQQNVFAAAGNYIESFGPVDAALYAGWYSAKAESSGITATANDRIGGYQGGVNFAYNIGDGSQIQLGGLYTQESLDAGTQNKHGYAGGLKYQIGRAHV